MKLAAKHVNYDWPAMRYQLSDDELAGINDLLRFYGPYSPLRRMTTYFGVGGSLPLYSGHVYCYDYDYIVRKILGLTGFSAQLNKALYAGGKGATTHDMFASSLSEAIERGLGMMEWFGKVGQVVYGSYREMTEQGYRCLSPTDLKIFAPEQFDTPDFPYEPFTEDTNIGWLQGRRLISGESTWVPAQLVAIFYPPLREDEALIGYSTSGGLASHINEKEAVLHGILEIFERDAVNIHWYCKVPPEVIEFDRAPKLPGLRSLLNTAAGLPSQPKFYLHRLDVPEVLVTTAVEYHDWITRYKYYAGGGVSTDIESCLHSSMSEFGQAMVPLGIALAAPDWGLADAMERLFGVNEDATPDELNVFIKILSYYGYTKNFEKLRWYVDSPRTVNLSSLPTTTFKSLDERWDYILGALDKHGMDPIVFDFSPPQFDNVRVMKTIIPELSPPFLPSLPMLGNARYYDLPQKLGLADHKLSYDELNTDPMPYP